MKLYYLLPFVFLSFLTATAQEDIETDRPDQTETTAIVPKGFFQMETGLMHENSYDDGDLLTMPTVLYKYGVTNKLEIRLQTDFIKSKTENTTNYGLSPILIGTKFTILKGDGFVPETSLITMVLIPKIASENLHVKNVAPLIKLLFENKITNAIDLDYNLDAEWDGNSQKPVFEFTFAPQFEITRKLKGFAEAYGYVQNHYKTDYWADTGLMFLITNNIQIDIAGGYELTPRQHNHDFFETVGISFRI